MANHKNPNALEITWDDVRKAQRVKSKKLWIGSSIITSVFALFMVQLSNGVQSNLSLPQVLEPMKKNQAELPSICALIQVWTSQTPLNTSSTTRAWCGRRKATQ